MEKSLTKDKAPPRLNPFLFPSDTDFRFILLIMAVVGSSLHMFSFLFHSWWVPANRQVYIEYAECNAALNPPDAVLSPLTQIDPLTASSDAVAQLQAEQQAFFNAHALCDAQIDRHFSVWNLTAVAILLAVAFLIYWLIPAWKIRRDRLTPLPEDTSDDIRKCLEQLCQTAGLKKNPKFLMRSHQTTVGGIAFGNRKQRYVALSGALITKFKTDPALFRAVVLHELAHLRNGDVDKTYFSMAIAISFTFIAFVPFLIDQLHVENEHQSLFDIVDSGGLAVIPLALLVYLILASVLRARELYADARAATWDDSRKVLQQFIKPSPTQQQSRWPVYLRVHPKQSDRYQSLETHGQLFQFSLWDAFATGVVTAIAIPTINHFLLFLLNLPYLNDFDIGILSFAGTKFSLSTYSNFVSALLIAPFAASTVCIGIWRASFAQRFLHNRSVPAGKIGLALSAGLSVGYLLSFDSISSLFALASRANSNYTLLGHLSQFLLNIAGISVMLLTLFLFCRWLVQGFELWLNVIRSKKELRKISAIIWSLITIILSVLISFLFHVRSTAFHFSEMLGFFFGPIVVVNEVLLMLIYSPIAMLTLAAIWLHPLAAKYVARSVPSTVPMSWALAEPDSTQIVLLKSTSVSFSTILRNALRVASKGCAAFVLLTIVTRIAIRMSFSIDARETELAKLAVVVFIYALGVVVQAVIALSVARRTRDHPITQGLFSAFIVGILISVSNWIINFIFNSTAGFYEALEIFLNLKLSLLSFSVFVNIGSFSALLALLLHAAMRDRFKKRISY